MFTAALFTVAKTWKQPKYPSNRDWIKKMWHIYTMGYYASTQKNEFMSFSGTWMNMKTIIFSKLTQEQKTKHHMCSLISGCWTMGPHGHREESITHGGLLQGTRGGTVGVGGWGGITWEEMSDIGDRGMEAANHIAMCVPMPQFCMICTCTPESKVQ